MSAGVAQYLLDNWTGAGRTALRLTAIGADALRVPEQKVKEIRDTVATLRLDAVTAVGFSMSRGKAAELIAAGRAEKLSRGHQGRRERGTGRRHFRAGTGKI